jgi:predicted dehydrogenase
MWMKCLPVFRKALEWFKSGKIGAIETIRVDFSNFVKFDPASRLFRKDLGGGAILDLGVYPVTLITAFLGFDYNKIVKYTNYGEIEIDRNDLIIFEYPNGVYTSSVIGFDIENENRAVIVGDKGRIAFDPWFFCTTKAKLYNKAGELLEDFDQPHPCNGYEFEILEAQHCLDKGLKESEIIPLEDSQRIMDILDYLLTQKSEVR